MLDRYKNILISLFERIHVLQSSKLEQRLVALEIQEELILRISRAERLIRQVRKKLQFFKSQLATRGNSKDFSRKIKTQIRKIENKIDRQKLLLWIFRTIGDSIAFIYGNKWDIKNYVLKDDSGFITGKRGFRLERKTLRYTFKAGGTAVLNDLTNSLRHCDLSIFRPDLWPDGNSPLFLIEAKSGKGGNKQRANRQMEAAKKIGNYITTDEKEQDGNTWKRIEAKNHSRHHFEVVKDLINKLPKAGFLTADVEPGLIYFIADTTTDLGPEEMLGSVLKKNNNYLILSSNDMKRQSWGYYPFPLCFINPNHLYRFYNGEFIFWVIVDIDTVNSIIAQKNLKIQDSNIEGRPWEIVPIKAATSDDHFAISVGSHIIGRLCAEFMTLEWMIENIICGPMPKEIEENFQINRTSTVN